MTDTEFEYKVRSVAEAFATYIDARVDLAVALEKYDGYSPSYALSNEFNRRDKAEKNLAVAFRALLMPTPEVE